MQARKAQVAEFESRYIPVSGEAPALSSPHICRLLELGRYERAADLVAGARALDRESRSQASFPLLQCAGFHVLTSLAVEVGSSGNSPGTLQADVQQQCPYLGWQLPLHISSAALDSHCASSQVLSTRSEHIVLGITVVTSEMTDSEISRACVHKLVCLMQCKVQWLDCNSDLQL